MLYRRVCSLALVLILALAAAAQVREKETSETREEKVRDILEKFNLAYQQKDVDALAKFVSPDLTAFARGSAFPSWEQYRDDFLSNAFSHPMPASTWEIEKIVTSPEMAWAYTKSSYKGRRQGQQVEADLYQLFVLQKIAASSTAKSKSSAASQPDWKIAVIDYSFHAQPLSPQAQPNAQPQATQPHLCR